MNKILIVEDDININNLLNIALKKANYACIQAFSGTEAVLLLEKEKFSIVLLDLMLPGISGEKVMEIIKKSSDMPVIVITAKDSLDDKVRVLLEGADDYIIKPFEIEEVLARIVVQLRKREKVDNSDICIHGKVRLDRTSYRVYSSDKHIPKITRQEFAILELLCRHPDRVYEKNEIFSLLWGNAYVGETKTLDMHISNIRKKFKNENEPDPIETIWGIGFKIK